MGSTESSMHDSQEQGSPTRSTPSVTALPAETRETIRTLGPLMQEGCSQSEIARRLGLPDATVAQMRKQMGDAIVEQAYKRLDDLEPQARQLVQELRAGQRSSTVTRAAGARTGSRRTGSPAGTTPTSAEAAAHR